MSVRASAGLFARARRTWDSDNVASLLTPAEWRIVLAVASGLITFVVTVGGLFITAPRVQSAVVAGIAIGLIASKRLHAGLVGLLVAVVGNAIGPASGWIQPGTAPNQTAAIFTSIACCVFVAVAARATASSSPKSSPAIMGLAVLILIASLWHTPLTMNNRPALYGNLRTVVPSFNEQLVSGIPPVLAWQDGAFFFRVYQEYNAHGDFYAQFDNAMRTDPRRGPVNSMAGFRTPLLFWTWSMLPNARWIVVAFLALATLAVLAVIPLTAVSVRAPLAVPGCAAVAAYFSGVPTDVLLFQPEEWAALLGILALAAFAVSTRSEKWKTWTLAGVALTVLAVLAREAIAFLAMAGALSAFVGDRSQRQYRRNAWLAGLVTLAVAFTAQYFLTKHYVVPTGEVLLWGGGSIHFMLAALHMGTVYLGQGGWLPVAMGVTGLAAAALVPDSRLRAFAAGALFATMLSFLFIGNDGWNVGSPDGAVNFWGIVVVPLLYALIPTALVPVPGARAT